MIASHDDNARGTPAGLATTLVCRLLKDVSNIYSTKEPESQPIYISKCVGRRGLRLTSHRAN